MWLTKALRAQFSQRFSSPPPVVPVPGAAGPKPPPGVQADHPLLLGARPLVATAAPLVISWSPKCACTQVLLWALHQEGLLDAAQYFSPWPHEFRGRVYYHSQTYHQAAAAVAKSDGVGFTLLRVTRDPTARLVSIFRHVLRTNVMWAQINDAVGRDTRETGLSIGEFGAFLSDKPLELPSDMDMHLLCQKHPVWNMSFDRVITINIDKSDLFEGLNEVAGEMGLAPTAFDRIPAFATIAGHHHSRDSNVLYDPDLFTKPMRALPDEPFPVKALRADPQVRSLAERLYHADIGETESGDSNGCLRLR